MRHFLYKKIRRETKLAKRGRPATLALKVNNLSDLETISLLYKAAEAGVKIRIIARSMFSLITGQDGPIGENIEAISIVDRYLEHSRVLIFGNDGDPEVYLSSADLLPRNFDSRIETIFPLLDKKLRQQLIDYFEIQWRDNVKARVLDRTTGGGVLRNSPAHPYAPPRSRHSPGRDLDGSGPARRTRDSKRRRALRPITVIPGVDPGGGSAWGASGRVCSG